LPRLIHEGHHFAGLGVTTKLLFRENELPVYRDFEQPTRRFDEPDIGVRKPRSNLGRQTGGPRFIVSDDAILNRNSHLANSVGSTTVN
jgi:hypothetical protein